MRDETEIDPLVTQAYSGLVPAPEVADEIAGALGDDRAARRRVPPGFVVALLAAAAVLVAVLVWAKAPAATPRREVAADPVPAALLHAVRLDVRADGSVKRGDEGPYTSKELVVALQEAAVSFDETMRARGESGRARAGQVEVSRLPVVLDVAQDCRWSKVQDVMVACAEARTPNLWLRHGDVLLPTPLPTDPGLGAKEPPVVRLDVKTGERIDLKAVALPREGVPVFEIHAVADARYRDVIPLVKASLDLGGGIRFSRAIAADQGGEEEEEEEVVEGEGGSEWLGRTYRIRVDSERAGDDVVHEVIEILGKRLTARGVKHFEIDLKSEKSFDVNVRGEGAKTPWLPELLMRTGGLELHATVEPTDAWFTASWERFQNTKEKEVPPEALPADVRKRFPSGLRWVPLAESAVEHYAPERLPPGKAPWVLVALDRYGIDETALEDVRCVRDGSKVSAGWVLTFGIKADYRPGMQALTAIEVGEDRHLAMIVGGEVIAAPLLRSPIRDRVELSGTFGEEKLRDLAALLSAPRLPKDAKLTLTRVEERDIDEK